MVTWGWSSPNQRCHCHHHRRHHVVSSPLLLLLRAILNEPEDSRYGRQDYWNAFYENKTSNFSWYAGWDDLRPFVQEFIHHDDHILIPGVGNDATLVHMYDDGFLHLTAMDYAPEGIERCREMLGEDRIRKDVENDIEDTSLSTFPGVKLIVADARDLPDSFQDNSFDAVIEKGTLDAIYLSGGKDNYKAGENLKLAISELSRCVKPGGIWMSIAAIVDEYIQVSFDSLPEWECLVEKGEIFETEDGYMSNNIDGTLLVWRKVLS